MQEAQHRTTAAPQRPRRTFDPSTVVDFVVVGSGAAGGVVAKELSSRGFTVVVLEQGPRLTTDQFQHDEFRYFMRGELSNNNSNNQQPQTGNANVGYHRLVGGGSVMFTANYWRFRPIDFNERSVLGAMSGTGLADWPITYQELEPYYTKAEWELGISGSPGPNDPPRSRPYPLPPLANKSSGVLFERGARALGLTPQVAPMCIISRPWRGRNGCQNCGYCAGFGCEHQAKSSTLFTVIPMAEATGRCEVRADSYASRVEMDDRGRATGVAYFDANKAEHVQKAKAVVLCANGAETPRLLLMSGATRFPNGLANSSGLVGKYLMFNGNSGTTGVYQHELNEWKGPMVTRNMLDFYNSDPNRGFYGGGGLDARFWNYPLFYALQSPPNTPQWGADYKRRLREDYSRTMNIDVHTTSLPVETNRIELDNERHDAWGLPVIKATYRDHPDDLATMKFLHDWALDIHGAAGAIRKWGRSNFQQGGGVHLLGTCRMGNDPATSVVDKYHRSHDVRNLFLCDGSSLVTGGRGQPTCTIQALAYRAGEHIARFARRNEI